MYSKKALEILTTLNDNGFEAYFVGGAVRDELMGVTPHDYDVTTSASPEDIKRVFGNKKLVVTGEKFGTITVVDGGNYEITSFRRDGEYADHRKPNGVDFDCNLQTDLSRRDFTMNAICCDANGNITDLFGGCEHIKNGQIVAIGDPDLRFCEDALRILRAVRFASQLGFSVEEKTKLSMLKNKSLVMQVSKERIFAEFIKIIQGKFAKKAILEFIDIILEIVPEFEQAIGFDQKSLSHKEPVFEHCLTVMESLKPTDVALRFTALFHDVGKPFSFNVSADGYRHFENHWFKSFNIVKSVLTRLKAPKQLVEEVSVMVLYHDEDFLTKSEIKSFMNKYSAKTFERILVHKQADLLAHTEHGIKKYGYKYYNSKSAFDEIVVGNEVYNLSQLKIDGNDLLELGVSGKLVGQMLDDTLSQIIQEKLINDKTTILKYLSEKYGVNVPLVTRRLICIGGGDIKNKTTLEVDEYIANLAKKRAGKRRANGLFIPTASHDYMPYFNSFRKTYTSVFDVKVDVCLTVFTDIDFDKIKQKFIDADFIYIGGGNTVFMLEQWKKVGLDKLILDAYARGVPIAGLSAGAICWFETMFTDGDSTEFSVDYKFRKGLGVVNGVCTPHYNQRKDEFDDKFCQSPFDFAYCLDDDTALEFENERVVHSVGSIGDCYVFAKKNGVINKYKISKKQ